MARRINRHLIPSILLQPNISLSRLSNRFDPRRAQPVLRQSLERPQLIANNLLSRKVPFSLRQLLKIHLLAASYFHWADLSRKRKTKPVINPHCHHKTHHPSSLIEVLRTLRDPRRMVSADQSWYSQHCSRYPGEQSFKIPASCSVVETAWGWVEEGWRVDVAFFDEEVVDDDDLMMVDG